MKILFHSQISYAREVIKKKMEKKHFDNHIIGFKNIKMIHSF